MDQRPLVPRQPRGDEAAAELDRSVVRALASAAGVVALLLLLAVAVQPGSLAVRVGDHTAVMAVPTVTSTVAPTSQAAPPRPEPSAVAEDTGALARAAVEDLLDLRDAAVATGDPEAWSRTAEPPGADAPAGADDGWAALSSLPITQFESSLVADSVRPVEDSDPTRWQARVETLYELADGPAVLRTDTVQLLRRDDVPPGAAVGDDGAGAPGGGDAVEVWSVESWTPFPEIGSIGTAAPWELGPVDAVVGERAVVLAWGEGSATWAGTVAGWADRGAVVVDSYVGTGWPRVTLVLAPATPEQFDALVPGPTPDNDDVFAAVTTDVDTPDGGGDLVVVNPTAREDLVEETWQVTVTHELVHVASGAIHGDDQEIWLAEGFADLVGWSTVVPSIAEREDIAGRLLERVQDGSADVSALPDPDDFGSDDADVVGDAYEGAWLATLLLEDQIGTEGLLTLYAQASDGDEPAAERTDRALRAATGETREQFEDRWSAYVTDLAAG